MFRQLIAASVVLATVATASVAQARSNFYYKSVQAPNWTLAVRKCGELKPIGHTLRDTVHISGNTWHCWFTAPKK